MDTMLSKALRWGQQIKRFLRKEPCWTNGNGQIKIDRSIPFDPVTFLDKVLDKGCSIKEQDERALVLTEIDFSKIRLETMFKPGETWVNGKERLKRLKRAGHIRLDAKIFQILWENKHLIPEKWKEKTNGKTTYIFFDGTVLWDYPLSDRFVLYLCWDGGEWHRGCCWLVIDVDAASGPSVVLAN